MDATLQDPTERTRRVGSRFQGLWIMELDELIDQLGGLSRPEC